MDEPAGEAAVLSTEELRQEHIQSLTERELHYAVAGVIFALLVFTFGTQVPEAMRLWLTALAGGLFFAASYTRLRRNLTIARR